MKCADLIGTYYANPSSGTRTVYALAIDLDADKADEQWKTKGALDWGKIRPFLLEEYPFLLDYLCQVTKSTSGLGLSVLFAISPLEIKESTKTAQRAAEALRKGLVQLFSMHGIGADPAARGIARDVPNWRNPLRVVEDRDLIRRSIDRNGRPAVMGCCGISTS